MTNSSGIQKNIKLVVRFAYFFDNSDNTMSHRYPWESTTQSTLQSKSKYSSPSSSFFSSTSNPKRVTSFATSATSKYTYTTASYLYANKYKTKLNNSNDSSSRNGNGSTTTRRYTNNLYYTVSPLSKVTNDLNYRKVSPFKRKSTVSTMSFPSTTKGDENGPQSDARGKRILCQIKDTTFFSDYRNFYFSIYLFSCFVY